MLSVSRVTRDVTRIFFGNPLAAFGVTVVGLLILAALFASVVAPHDPREVRLESQFLPPGPGHWFGTDSAGSDVFSRVIFGSREALGTGVLVLAISLSVGCTVGLFAGYAGGAIGEVLMRVTDMFLAFPGLLLAMAVVAALRQRTVWTLVVAVSLRWWAPYARISQAQALSIREHVFVEAARSLGAGDATILRRHILPNALGPIIVQATLDWGNVILTMASLSFLGFGAQPGEPSWGRMVTDGLQHLRGYWWISVFPGLAILFTVLAFNLAGDSARDAFDPRLRGE